MWFLSELEHKTRYTEQSIYNYFDVHKIKIRFFHSGNKFLGFGVSDKDGDNFIKEHKGEQR